MTTGTPSRWGTPETVFPSSAVVHRIETPKQLLRAWALAVAWQETIRTEGRTAACKRFL